jgi:hypothetical protein
LSSCLQVIENTGYGFPSHGVLARRVHSAVGGNMLSWIKTADGAQLEDMCRAVAVGVDWARALFQRARQEKLDNVRKVLSVDETDERMLVVNLRVAEAVDESLRVNFEDVFHLREGGKGMFESSALKELEARLVAEGLGPFVDSWWTERVARDLVWITAVCALSRPPFHLSGEGIGRVEAYDGTKRHMLVDGDAGPRVRVLFPAVPGLLPRSLCLPDEEPRD